MKKISAVISVLLTFAMLLSFLTACSDNGNTKPTALSTATAKSEAETQDESKAAEEEKENILKYVLADDYDAFDGKLSSLEEKEAKKVEKEAEKKGYTVTSDKDDNIVLEKVEPTVAAKTLKKIRNESGIKNDKVSSDKEYEKVSKAAAKEGVIASKDDEGNISYTPETTAASDNKSESNETQNQTEKEITTKKKDSSDGSSSGSSGGSSGSNGRSTGTVETGEVTFPNETVATTEKIELKDIETEWVETKNGGASGFYNKSDSTEDGIVAVGTTYLNSKGKALSKYGAIITGYNEKGKEKWSNVYYGDQMTAFEDVAVLSDGSIIAVGQTLASKGLVSEDKYKAKGTVEGICVKFDEKGNEEWINIIGGSNGDIIYSVAATPDGGFVIGGKTESHDGDMDGISEDYRISAFIIKYDSDCSREWISYLQGSKHCSTDALTCDENGNIYASISTVNHDGSFKNLGDDEKSIQYCVAVKLNSSGKILWKKDIWESGPVILKSIETGYDGTGCVLAGSYASRIGGNVGTFKNVYNGGKVNTFDGVCVRLDDSGKISFIKTFMGISNDELSDIVKVPGGYAISAYSTSSNRDFPLDNSGDYDCYMFVMNDYGRVLVTNGFAGSLCDKAQGICANENDIYIVGATNSNDIFFKDCDEKGTKDKSVAFAAKFALSEAK